MSLQIPANYYFKGLTALVVSPELVVSCELYSTVV